VGKAPPGGRRTARSSSPLSSSRRGDLRPERGGGPRRWPCMAEDGRRGGGPGILRWWPRCRCYGVAAGAGHGGGAEVAAAKFFGLMGLRSMVCSGLRRDGGGCRRLRLRASAVACSRSSGGGLTARCSLRRQSMAA
jgi:hypothetical protein